MRNFLLFAFLLFSLNVFSQGSKPDTICGLAFKETMKFFPNAKSGPPLKMEYEFTNLNDFPVHITRVRTSDPHYGTWSREPVLPGKKGKIKVTMPTKYKIGSMYKSTIVNHTVGDKSIILKFKGRITIDTPRDRRVRFEILTEANNIDNHQNKILFKKSEIDSARLNEQITEIIVKNNSVNNLWFKDFHLDAGRQNNYHFNFDKLYTVYPSNFSLASGKSQKLKIIWHLNRILDYRPNDQWIHFYGYLKTEFGILDKSIKLDFHNQSKYQTIRNILKVSYDGKK